MPKRRAVPIVLLAAAFGAAPLGVSCFSSPSSGPDTGPYTGQADRQELSELFPLLHSARDSEQRFAALHQIATNLMRQKEYARLGALFSGIEDSAHPGDRNTEPDPYGAWYLFTAAYAYEQCASAPIAAIYYDRALRNEGDAMVDGHSIHRECLSRLIAIVDSPERRIAYYKDLIGRFPDEAGDGRTLFLLAKEYERVGDWELAIKTYSEFLPFFGTPVPGYPDAYRYARGIVDFYNSPKDWAYRDLPTLVGKIKAALAGGDAYKLRTYRAKVNFFASEWTGADVDSNPQSLFDFSDFMTAGPISAAPELDSGSNRREAYLKTWGWADKISTWYLYFRKVYFPADPEIHGSWEWAGIYFGEKPR